MASSLQVGASARLDELLFSQLGQLAPPPDLLVSEWAERYRVLEKGTTSRPGPWRSEAYQVEIMNALVNPEVHEVVFMKSTQVGYSEILNNIIGYFIHIDPKPIMLVQPTDENARDYGRKRITPLIRNCPELQERVREAKARKGGNTMRLKEFPGGFLKLVGANAGSGLRSDPVPIVLFDEVEGYPDDVEGQGDPIEQGSRRTDQYPDYKIFKGSTPGKPKGYSKIERAYERSDQRRYYVPCPFCGFMQVLWWRDPLTKKYNLKYELTDDGEVIKNSVVYLCCKCGKGIPERYKQQMVDAGEWVAAYPGRSVVGFHINALYSVWKENWHKLAQEWKDAQNKPEELRTFVNLRLGETYEEAVDAVTDKELSKRERFKLAEGVKVPMGVAALVATADVQHNRIEVQVTGFGPGEEQWLIDHEVFWGSPGLKPGQKQNEDEVNVWDELDDYLLKEWPHESGAMLRTSINLIDSGAYSASVYEYVMPRQNLVRRCYATKGVDFLPKPGLAMETTSKKHKVRLFLVGTYAGKDRTFARLNIKTPGPGYCHFPESVTDEYFQQLTAESKVPVINKRTRRVSYVYVQSHPRNEALDMTVMAHAGLWILQNTIDPITFKDLSTLHAEVVKGRAPRTLVPQRQRKVLSPGIS